MPLVRTLQAAWPQVRLTWVIGRGEHRLLAGLPGVDFVEYDKKTGLAGMRAMRRELRARLGTARRFDALLQMQVAARANLLSAFVPAQRRVGYDRSRAKDGRAIAEHTAVTVDEVLGETVVVRPH